VSGVPEEVAMIARIERIFRRTFGERMTFQERLERKDEPRWTSLKHVEFIIALEQEFGLRFDGADATDMVSIAAVRERVARLLAEKQKA
jgi:acyl carrier protein